MQSQASTINGEYMGDEFHFRLRMPAPAIPDGGKQRIEMFVPSPPDSVTKMGKEERMWQVHEGEMSD